MGAANNKELRRIETQKLKLVDSDELDSSILIIDFLKYELVLTDELNYYIFILTNDFDLKTYIMSNNYPCDIIEYTYKLNDDNIVLTNEKIYESGVIDTRQYTIKKDHKLMRNTKSQYNSKHIDLLNIKLANYTINGETERRNVMEFIEIVEMLAPPNEDLDN
jgi:hypothetical protein